ncbi:MAG TPA: Hint domain-containing protein, partial [Bacillota bacterium]|nr:Hint domain-containing protein [Bacillota bacterium]
PARQGVGGDILDCAADALPDPGGVADGIPEFIDGLRAIANAEGRCVKDNTALAIAGGVAIGMTLYNNIMGLFDGIAERVAGFIGCVIGSLLANGLDTGAAGPGGGSSVQNFQRVGAGCFAAETRVLLADGRFKTIDQIQAGDVVRSGAGLQEVATVDEIYCLPSETCRQIRFVRSGQTEPDSVQTTDEHLFWVDGRGWIAAAQLRVGDWLFNPQNQRLQIIASERIPGRRQVYTFKLHGDVAFYANGILVHDLCGPTPAVGNPKSQTPVLRSLGEGGRNAKQTPIEKEDHGSTQMDTKPGGRNATSFVGANLSN